MAVTLRCKSGNESNNITIINVYDSQEESSFKNRRKQKMGILPSTLDSLLDFITRKKFDKILLVGDFNARTKDLNHKLVTEKFEIHSSSIAPRSEPMDYPRASKDSTINPRGKLFLDFAACSNITLLNGCTIGDIFGEYTSCNYKGISVVDYIGVSQSLFSSIYSFKVGNLTSFSDHKPCYCSIKMKNDITSGDLILNSLEDAPKIYR